MRIAQYMILTRVLERVDIPDYIHAFERGRSIPEMAQQHTGKGLVISLDLKDFFTSIKQRHLKQIFEHLGVGEAPARTLSEICTYQSFVPQGGLTSPKVSNIVSSLTFGPVLKRYCDENNLTLSIYADDITISCNEVPSGQEGNAAVGAIISRVTEVVTSFGFRINRAKTKIMRPHQRQYVCGVVVNERTNLQQRERRRLRAIVHNCLVNGIQAECQKSGVSAETFISQITGRINWFSQLNQEKGSDMMENFRRAIDSYRESVVSDTSSADVQTITETSPAEEVNMPVEVPWETEEN